ncbi:hypothetical protein [Georgenia sp. AZ-5]|uniref:hypothetical protein n=1 Tax=Georgenia sp. AZ-5 TaxID=3367526 RepID=UPI00375509D9
MTIAALGGALAAALVSAACVAVLVPLLRRAMVVDVPVERSLHDAPVPRGGGLALVPAVLAGLLATGVLATGAAPGSLLMTASFHLILALATVLTFAIIGLWDDLYGVSALARLLLQIVAAMILSLGILLAADRSLIWLPVLAATMVALVNITNFMDGANGLLGFHGVVSAGWFAVVAAHVDAHGAVALALAILGAIVGFLPFNVPAPRVFLGDVGSYLLGAAWAALGAWLLLADARIETVIAPLAVFGADTAYTLWLRLRAGQRWYQPHKLHVYQRLVAAGWSHVASSATVAGVAILCCLLAVPAMLGAGVTVRLLCLAAMALVCVAYLKLPVRVGAPEPWHKVRTSTLR